MTTDWVQFVREFGPWALGTVALAWFMGFRVWPFVVDQVKSYREEAAAMRLKRETEYLAALEAQRLATLKVGEDLAERLAELGEGFRTAQERQNKEMVEAFSKVLAGLEAMQRKRGE